MTRCYLLFIPALFLSKYLIQALWPYAYLLPAVLIIALGAWLTYLALRYIEG